MRTTPIFMRALFTLGFGLLSLSPIAKGASHPVNAEKELVIRDLSVVEDPRAKGLGAWSFGGIFTSLAPSATEASAFFRAWTNQWSDVKDLNGYPVTPRPASRYLSLWPIAERKELNLAKAPFRLLAITYRPEVANAEAPFGEARLVFCGVRPTDHSGVDFLVILEFKLPESPKVWAEAFHRLGERDFGEAYNAELEAITRKLFTRANLLRVRTNDFFGDAVWEFRQFQLNGSGALVQVPLTDTPDLSFDSDIKRKELLAKIIVANESAILAGTFKFPEDMLTGASWAPVDSFRWLYDEKSTTLPEQARHLLSQMTCNGCHSGETGTIFAHINPRGAKYMAPLSPFLERSLSERGKKMLDLIEAP